MHFINNPVSEICESFPSDRCARMHRYRNPVFIPIVENDILDLAHDFVNS